MKYFMKPEVCTTGTKIGSFGSTHIPIGTLEIQTILNVDRYNNHFSIRAGSIF